MTEEITSIELPANPEFSRKLIEILAHEEAELVVYDQDTFIKKKYVSSGTLPDGRMFRTVLIFSKSGETFKATEEDFSECYLKLTIYPALGKTSPLFDARENLENGITGIPVYVTTNSNAKNPTGRLPLVVLSKKNESYGIDGKELNPSIIFEYQEHVKMILDAISKQEDVKSEMVQKTLRTIQRLTGDRIEIQLSKNPIGSSFKIPSE